MTNFVIVTSADRKQRKIELLKLMAARSDFGGARDAARVLLKYAPEIGSDLNYPLLVAAIVCYSRPFTANKPYGALPGRYLNLLSDTLRSLHNEITSARNKYFAHSDLTEREACILPKGALIASSPSELRSAGLGSAMKFYLYPPETLQDLANACCVLLDQLTIDINALLVELYEGLELPACRFRLAIDNGL